MGVVGMMRVMMVVVVVVVAVVVMTGGDFPAQVGPHD